MRPAAGKYNRRLQWMQRALGTPDTFGEKPQEYTSQGYLWGAVDDRSGGTRTYLGADQADPRATVRLRNYPGVRAGDRLVDAGWSETWEVLDVHRGDNEIVCEVGPGEDP